jgi:hypothetical protein
MTAKDMVKYYNFSGISDRGSGIHRSAIYCSGQYVTMVFMLDLIRPFLLIKRYSRLKVSFFDSVLCLTPYEKSGAGVSGPMCPNKFCKGSGSIKRL